MDARGSVMPWLTAIVPAHDGSAFLAATLAAAAAEDPQGVEFLIFDSSNDDGACRDIVERFADRLDLRYVPSHDFRSWTAKTNRGAELASAPHLTMLHQDDLWLPGHLAALRAAITRAPQAALSVGPSTFIDANGATIGRWNLPFSAGVHGGNQLATTLLVQNTIAIPSALILRDAWLSAGGLDEVLWYTADWDLYLKLALMGDVDVRPETTTAFRVHASSLTISGSRNPDEFREQQEIVVERYLPRLPAAARRRYEPQARAAVTVNCALASGNGRGIIRASRALASLGPVGAYRFLARTRLVDRVLPRLRLRLAGMM